LLLEGGEQVHYGFGRRPDGSGIQGAFSVYLHIAGMGKVTFPGCLLILAGGGWGRYRFAHQRARLRRQDLHLDGVFRGRGILEFLKRGIQIAAGGYHQRREKNRQAGQAGHD